MKYLHQKIVCSALCVLQREAESGREDIYILNPENFS